MQLVFTFCQTSFPARHALQSVTAFLFKVLVHTLLVGSGFFVCFTLHPIYNPLPLEGRKSEGKNIPLYSIHAHQRKKTQWSQKNSLIVIALLQSVVQAMPCGIWNIWTALKHKKWLPEEHAIIFKSLQQQKVSFKQILKKLKSTLFISRHLSIVTPHT